MEALGRYAEANAVYAAMLEKNPANSFAAKRQVCTLLAQGRLEAGAKALNGYLQTYQGDVAAWQQMAELQLQLNNLKGAAFAYEELLLCEPTNFLYHTTYAELLYSLGGCDNLRLARRYFAQSLELNRANNARATYGLVAATFALAAQFRAGGAARADKSMTPREEREDVVGGLNARLHKLGAAKLEAEYKGRPARARGLVTAMLKRTAFLAEAAADDA